MAELMRNKMRLDPHLFGGVAQRLPQRREQHVAAFGPRQKELRIGRRWQCAEEGETLDHHAHLVVHRNPAFAARLGVRHM